MTITTQPTDILLAFAPVPDAVRTARHALRDRGLNPDLEHTVALLTSEVVGNSVRHAGPLAPGQRIVFHARLADDHVRIEVADHGPGFDPEVRHDTPGFGLRLVDKLASRWGADCTPRGCRVWFEIDRRPGRFLRDGQ
jgi:two-component sensor histidine kinase